MRVLVTGGAGYIGSVVSEELAADGHEVVVLDDLSKGHRDAVLPEARFVEADIGSARAVREVLSTERIEAVVHMAAFSLVGESVSNPAKYFRNNVTGSLTLLDAMIDVGVERLVFSSTAAVYGEPQKQPIEETDPAHPTNPYGDTKLAFERALPWYENAHGLKWVSLRYFNAAGASQRHGEHHDPETHLIPIALEVAAGRRSELVVFGDDYPTPDGTCVRDYIHVVDLARAHVLALSSARSAVYNLGCGGSGYSVTEVVDTAAKVSGQPITVRVGPRRAGDPAVLVASSDRIKQELGWVPQHQDLETIVASAWAWMQRHPQGYVTR
jgi:UDP-glucose 4-epimerase